MQAADSFLYAALGTAFTFAMTTLGALSVFFFRKEPHPVFTKLSLGFASGIMIAASVWSLLIPALEGAEESFSLPIIPVAGGFCLGALFLILLDHVMPHLHIGAKEAEGPHVHLQKDTLLFLAVTIHNIPEGMAVGIACAAAAGTNLEGMSAAMALALGMGIQNIPEGAAVTLPMYAAGHSRRKAFLMGAISGIVEPIAAMLTVLAASFFMPLMPWLLAFAAGAMLYVVVEELIPEARLGEHSDLGSLVVMGGFLLMMVLDTSLG